MATLTLSRTRLVVAAANDDDSIGLLTTWKLLISRQGLLPEGD